MRVLALAALIGACAAPAALAAEGTQACQSEVARRCAPEEAAPAASATVQAEAPPPDSAATPRRAGPVARRRGARRIPDAELIGPHGAL